MKQFFRNNKTNPWFRTFVIVATVLLFAMPIMSRSAGNSGDEDGFQIPQGNYVLEWYKTLGEDTTNLSFQNLKYYGSSFDVVMAFVNQTFHVDNIHITRHAANALLGWLCVVFVGLIAFRIAGWRAGVIAMILLFLSPRFLGHAFNNPKDIPFAAAVVMAVFFMFQFFRQFPKVKKTTVVFLTLSIALSISVRIGGLVLFGFFGFFALLFFIQNALQYRSEQKQKITLKKTFEIQFRTSFKRLFLYGVGICIAGYFLGLILWPYALQAPIKHPLESFSAMSQFAVSLRQNFEGSMIWSDMLPWYYTPKFILISIPVAVIAGFLIYLFVGGLKKENRFSTIAIYFVAIFPVFWLVYTHANVYGGWRHSLFAYPFIVVVAGLGFNALIELAKQKYAKIALTALPFLLLIPPALFIAQNHPYEYTYFNELTGGIKGAYGNYETDYYYHSTREASEWVIQNAEKSGLETSEKIKVATWHIASVAYFFRHDTAKFEVGFSRWYERGNNDWDYAIFAVTGMSPDMLKSSAFPPANTVYEVKVSGKPICVVLKRTDKSDYYGNILKREGKTDSAVMFLQKSLTVVPTDESVLLNLSEIYLNSRKLDSAILYLDQLLAFDPKNESANYYKAYALMFANRLTEAQTCLQTVVNHNPKNEAAPWMAAQIYAQQGNLMGMEKMIEKTLLANANKQQDALNMMQQVYPQMGLSANDATSSFTKIWIRVLEQLGYKEEAKQLKGQR